MPETTPLKPTLAALLDALPHRYPGPGGVAGVVQDGRVIAARAWGHADTDARRPMTRATRLPICSISKQFTCALVQLLFEAPEALDADVAAFLPQFAGTLPTTRQLMDNQSGLRDYWALTVLQGAHAEQPFPAEMARPLMARMKSGHFAPGTSYSYNNCNFRILGEILAARTGRTIPALLAEHLFGPAGMTTAEQTSDTRFPLDGVTGYEGSPATGYLPAANAIFWEGDAGISAALDDMLAWECHIDATRDDPAAPYRRISTPPTFADGAPANYGMGLQHHEVAGVAVTGHGGALRGFRAHRMHAAAERLSVVVMFNHEGDAFGAASALLAAALGQMPAAPPAAILPEGWDGQWLDPDTGLSLRLHAGRHAATLQFGTGAEVLQPAPEGLANATTRIALDGETLVMQRPGENRVTRAEPLPPLPAALPMDFAGRYVSDELEAAMVIEIRDGGVHAWFDGLLGEGPAERLHPLSADVWLLASRRSMDAPAPGDWTLRLERDAAGAVSGARLGCWLARDIGYRRA